MAGFPTFKGFWPWRWIGAYCIPIVHQTLTSTCMPNVIENGSNFMGTDRLTYVRTHGLTDALCQVQSHMTQIFKTRRVAVYLETHCNIRSKRAFPTGSLDRWHNSLLIYLRNVAQLPRPHRFVYFCVMTQQDVHGDR